MWTDRAGNVVFLKATTWASAAVALSAGVYEGVRERLPEWVEAPQSWIEPVVLEQASSPPASSPEPAPAEAELSELHRELMRTMGYVIYE